VKNLMGRYSKVSIIPGKGLGVTGSVTDSPHEDAKHVRFQLVEGSLKTLSIGGSFFYLDDYHGIEEIRLHEISIVVVPANADATIQTRPVDKSFCEAAFKAHYQGSGGVLRAGGAKYSSDQPRHDLGHFVGAHKAVSVKAWNATAASFSRTEETKDVKAGKFSAICKSLSDTARAAALEDRHAEAAPSHEACATNHDKCSEAHSACVTRELLSGGDSESESTKGHLAAVSAHGDAASAHRSAASVHRDSMGTPRQN
jgi:hypothetical protein